jgi:CheY-like chemotaxis protein
VTGNGEPEVRVLLVGSSAELVPSLRPGLERAGYEVVVTDDADPGLALVEAFMPDVVLVEHELPSGTGFDVLRAIRSDPRCAGTGVVVVMGDGHGGDMLTALDQGADDFLCPPFKPVEVLARVQAVLRQRTIATPARVAEARLATAVASRPSSDAGASTGAATAAPAPERSPAADLRADARAPGRAPAAGPSAERRAGGPPPAPSPAAPAPSGVRPPSPAPWPPTPSPDVAGRPTRRAGATADGRDGRAEVRRQPPG